MNTEYKGDGFSLIFGDTPSAEHPDEIYLFDIDGTLSNNDFRQHLIDRDEPNWDKYHEMVGMDAPIYWTIHMAREIPVENVYLLTSRPDSTLADTMNWLFKLNIRYNRLYMRESGNIEPSARLKERITRDFRDKIVWVAEDRPDVVEMWKATGVKVIQPNASMLKDFTGYQA
jgi:hypothetical protein